MPSATDNIRMSVLRLKFRRLIAFHEEGDFNVFERMVDGKGRQFPNLTRPGHVASIRTLGASISGHESEVAAVEGQLQAWGYAPATPDPIPPGDCRSEPPGALPFWATAYRAGVRITSRESRPIFTAAWDYWRRAETFGGFGQFPADEPVIPPAWVTEQLSAHWAGLKTWLGQSLPAPYADFAHHLLVLEYEAKPIVYHAQKAGMGINSQSVNGGWVLVADGRKQEPLALAAPPRLKPIVNHLEEVQFG